MTVSTRKIEKTVSMIERAHKLYDGSASFCNCMTFPTENEKEIICETLLSVLFHKHIMEVTII